MTWWIHIYSDGRVCVRYISFTLIAAPLVAVACGVRSEEFLRHVLEPE